MNRTKKGTFKKGSKPWNKGQKKQATCKVCKKNFNKYGKSGNLKKTCSKECRIKAIKIARSKQVITKKHREAISKSLRQEKAKQWKGNRVSYSGLHRWLYKYKIRPDECQYCGKPNKTINNRSYLHWANISGEYKRELNDYIALCPSCHKKYDLGYINI
jgi:Zn finger protein HypA/HybF involved in hydrogenase expression